MDDVLVQMFVCCGERLREGDALAREYMIDCIGGLIRNLGAFGESLGGFGTIEGRATGFSAMREH